MRRPANNTKIHFGTFLPKTAGNKVSYDAGICSVIFHQDQNKGSVTLGGKEYPTNKLTIKDYFYRNKVWFNYASKADKTWSPMK